MLHQAPEDHDGRLGQRAQLKCDRERVRHGDKGDLRVDKPGDLLRCGAGIEQNRLALFDERGGVAPDAFLLLPVFLIVVIHRDAAGVLTADDLAEQAAADALALQKDQVIAERHGRDRKLCLQVADLHLALFLNDLFDLFPSLIDVHRRCFPQILIDWQFIPYLFSHFFHLLSTPN